LTLTLVSDAGATEATWTVPDPSGGLRPTSAWFSEEVVLAERMTTMTIKVGDKRLTHLY
jgi:hypothetical protein